MEGGGSGWDVWEGILWSGSVRSRYRRGRRRCGGVRRGRRSWRLGILSNKDVPWHILAPSAVACDMFLLRASAHHWHVSAFLCNREFQGISCYTKKDRRPHRELRSSHSLTVLLRLPVSQPERLHPYASGYGSSCCFRTLRLQYHRSYR